MEETSPDATLPAIGAFDLRLEGSIDLRPADPGAIKAVLEVVGLVKTFVDLGVHSSTIEVLKSVAAVGGWSWQRRKSERAQAFLLGLYERLERTRFEYTKRDEFPDLFEETLRLIAEQPEVGRREKMRRIFLNIVERPREHVENRLLLRLADELPSECLEILTVLDRVLTEEERALGLGSYALALRLGQNPSEFSWPLSILVNANLMDEDSFNTSPGIGAAGGNLLFLLTPLGRTFVDYIRD